MSKNPKSLIAKWNLAIQAAFPHLYAEANRPGRVVFKGKYGTHLGNNRFVTYDGRRSSKKLTPAKSLTKNYKRQSSHAAREHAKGVLMTDAEYAKDSTKFAAALVAEVIKARFPKNHPLAKLSVQQLVDLFSVISPALISGAMSRIKNHDRDFEDAHPEIFWAARGFEVDVTKPDTVQAACDGYAARQYATTAQTAIALKLRSNELKQVRLSKQCKKVAPTAEIVKVDAKGIPTKKPVTRADVLAVLKAV